jgi:hypothetical protein
MTTTTTTIRPIVPAASGSPFAPQKLKFVNNDKLTNSDPSTIDDFLIFNPYIHYYPRSSSSVDMVGDAADVSYQIDYISDYRQSTRWDEYSREYRDRIE